MFGVYFCFVLYILILCRVTSVNKGVCVTYEMWLKLEKKKILIYYNTLGDTIVLQEKY